jgi:protein TorT
MDVRWLWCGLLAGAALALAPGVAVAQAAAAPLAAVEGEDRWFPQSVERREPPFFEGGAFTRLDYVPLDRATEPWELCAVVPPQEVEYFRALAGGMQAEAARQGVILTVEALETFDPEAQARRLEACLERDSDALLIAAAARDGLGPLLARARAGDVPVIDVVVGAGSDNVTARIVTDRAAVGRAAGRFLAERHPLGSEPARVVWLYGPPGSDVAREIDRGFRAAIARGAIELVHAEAVPLTDRDIRRAIRAVVDEFGRFDGLVGGSLAVRIAAEELAAAFANGTVALVSVSPSTAMLAGIEAERIFAAVNDKAVVQGRIGVDLAIRAIEGRPHMIDLRPRLDIIDRSNVERFDRTTILPPD